MNLTKILAAAERYGLHLRGGFSVTDDDDVPKVNDSSAKHLLLFGNAGSSFWDSFSRSDEYRDKKPDPLNRWSLRIGGLLADEFLATALFPFGATHHPFLAWGRKSEALHNSQLGMLMHPRFGLWHAYRFALAFAESVDENQTEQIATDHCATCESKPCLYACPVNAFTTAGYDVRACYNYLEANADSACMREGCQARVACPQGAGFRYEKAHAAFHMRAFVIAMAAQEFPDDAHKNAPRDA